jgi:leader peptidase (prepilin peptidase)/N-methyltransferase
VRLRLAAALTWVGLAIACLAVFGLTVEAVVNALGCAVVVAITVTDIERRIVPNRIVLPATAIILAAQVALSPDRTLEWTAAALGAALFLLLPLLIYPSGMGMGDVKLAGVLGLYLGRTVAPAVFIALIGGVVVGAAVIARKGARQGRKTAVPFGPFLALGGLIAFFVGEDLVDAYLDTF